MPGLCQSPGNLFVATAGGSELENQRFHFLGVREFGERADGNGKICRSYLAALPNDPEVDGIACGAVDDHFVDQ